MEHGYPMAIQLQQLPFEVLEHICSYLRTIDMIKLTELNTVFENISCRKKNIQKVDLFCEYYIKQTHLTKYLVLKPRSDFITSINLSCIYWIPAVDIRRCLCSLHNLECLYLVDTKMSMSLPDVKVYNYLTKLRKLALSVTVKSEALKAVRNFLLVTHFYLHLDYDEPGVLTEFIAGLRTSECLEELWLIQSGGIFPSHYSEYIPSRLVRLCYFSRTISLSGTNEAQCEIYNQNHQDWPFKVVEKRDSCSNHTRICDIDFKSDWNTLFYNTKNNNPFTLKQTTELIAKKTIDGFMCEDINITHSEHPNAQYETCLRGILLSDHMKSLKKLAINYCMGICNDNVMEENSSAKRIKEDCLFSKIVGNSPNIEELEMWTCERTDINQKLTSSCFEGIQQLKFLRKLTLDNLPLHINGSFLINVFLCCQYLSSLRLKSVIQNTSLYNNLCLSLKHATSLKDLRYEQNGSMNINRIMEIIVENKKLSIERLFIKCESVELFSSQLLCKLLDISLNLKFMNFVISELPKNAIKQLTKCFNKYNNDSQKVLLITRIESSHIGRTQIPLVYIYDMVVCHTRVSRIDMFNEYVSL